MLGLLAEGRTNPEIANALFISPPAADTHVAKILAKLGVSSRRDAIARGRERGLLSDRPDPARST